MPKAIPRGPLIRIEGLEPRDDPAWSMAGPRGHKAFYTFVAQDALRLKLKSLERGLDIYGKTMRIRESTRQNRKSAMGPAYYRAPALTPSFEASRTRAYLRAEGDATGATLWWRHDPRTGDSWGVILQYQADFRSDIAPNGRNVIGMSEGDLDKNYRNAMRWWQANRVRLAQAGVSSGSRGGRLVLNLPPVLVAPKGTAPPPLIVPPVAPGAVPTFAQLVNLNLTQAQRNAGVRSLFGAILGGGKRGKRR